jgi:hypothetical protein
VVHAVVEQGGADTGNEERVRARLRAEPVAALGIAMKRLGDRGVQRDQSGVAELGLPEGEQPLGEVGEVDVVAVQCDRFAEPDAFSLDP